MPRKGNVTNRKLGRELDAPELRIMSQLDRERGVKQRRSVAITEIYEINESLNDVIGSVNCAKAIQKLFVLAKGEMQIWRKSKF